MQEIHRSERAYQGPKPVLEGVVTLAQETLGGVYLHK
jgi:hypothetical protein